MQVKKQQLEPDMEQQTGSKLGKENIKAVYCHPSYLIYIQNTEEEVKSLSRVRLFVTPWTEAHQAPPSMKFSRQEYWSGLPFPSPGNLPNLGIEPGSPALGADALLSEPPGKPGMLPETFRKCLSVPRASYSKQGCAWGCPLLSSAHHFRGNWPLGPV